MKKNRSKENGLKGNTLKENGFKNIRLRNCSSRNIFLMAIILLFCASLSYVFLSRTASYAADIENVKEQLLKKFPRTQRIDEIKESPIKGLYEITTPQMIYYYCPEKELLIFGEIWDSTGRSLTAERRAEAMAKKLQNLSLDKAVKIGKGKNTVIEFVDPECPHCKTVYNHLKDKDVTIYAFIVPLLGQKSEKKVKYFLCAKDKATAYHAIMSNQDAELSGNCNISDEQLNGQLNELRQFLSNYGLTGVPFLVVNGSPVNGANINLIDELLKNSKK